MRESITAPVPLLRDYFRYDELTGNIWKTKRLSAACRFDRPIGTLERGYLVARFLGRKFYVHRMAWALYHGEWPERHIDHINGNPTDNRICNLRVVDDAQNGWNSKDRPNKSTGVRGVRLRADTGRFTAGIRVRMHVINLGCFDTIEEATEARLAAEKRMHGEFAFRNRNS